MDTEEQIALKKATKIPRKRKSMDEEEAEVKSEKKHKKSKKDAVEPAVAEVKEEKRSKKKKDSEDSEEGNLDNEKAARKEKKRLKKEKKEKKAAAALKDAEDAKAKEAEAEKVKDKSSKKARQPKLAAQPVASADQWNPDALTGDAARKNKFLRLLGAGKGAGIEAAPKKQQASDKDIQRVESELERQFAAGIRMKHGGMGKRTGLGM